MFINENERRFFLVIAECENNLRTSMEKDLGHVDEDYMISNIMVDKDADINVHYLPGNKEMVISREGYEAFMNISIYNRPIPLSIMGDVADIVMWYYKLQLEKVHKVTEGMRACRDIISGKDATWNITV